MARVRFEHRWRHLGLALALGLTATAISAPAATAEGDDLTVDVVVSVVDEDQDGVVSAADRLQARLSVGNTGSGDVDELTVLPGGDVGTPAPTPGAEPTGAPVTEPWCTLEAVTLAPGSSTGCGVELTVDAGVLSTCTAGLAVTVRGTAADGRPLVVALDRSAPLDLPCAADGSPTPTPEATALDPSPTPSTAPAPSVAPSTTPGPESGSPSVSPSPSAAPRSRTAAATETSIQRKYRESGGASGPLGKQTSGEKQISGGAYATYEKGRIYWSPGNGSHIIRSGFLTKYLSAGGPAKLGFPAEDQQCGAAQNGCFQRFGPQVSIHWLKGVGYHVTKGVFRAAWGRANYEKGKLGYPVGDQRCGLPGGGCYQSFQRGSVHWSPKLGAFWSTGSIRTVWAGYGWERGILGYPRTDQRCNSGGCWQWFQYGKVEYKPGRGTWALPDFRPVIKRTTSADVKSTYRSGCPVPPSKLRTITMSYWGYDGRARRGTLIVRDRVAEEVASAFGTAYRAKYRIARMDNPNVWGGSDPKMMTANNTSGFNCRAVVGNPYAVSPHSYGTAIDNNTVQNPYRDARGTWWPSNGKSYILGAVLNRPKKHPAIHRTDSTMVRALESRGWFWGGRWSSRDYHHFEED